MSTLAKAAKVAKVAELSKIPKKEMMVKMMRTAELTKKAKVADLSKVFGNVSMTIREMEKRKVRIERRGGSLSQITEKR